MSSIIPDDGASPRGRLQRLDDRVVPGLQRVAQGTLRRLGLPFRWLDDRVASGRIARAVTEHRGAVAFLVVGIAFTAAAVHAQRWPELREQARAAAQEDRVQTVREPGATPHASDDDGSGVLAGGAVAVGPARNARIEPYVEDRRAALAAQEPDATVVAVVSFTSFLGPQAIEELLPTELTRHVAQYQLPERAPRPAQLEVVGDDLAASVDRVVGVLVEDLREEEEAVESTLASGVTDEDFRRDYERRLDELKSLRNVLSTDPSIVFAVVVEGPAGTLQDLAEHESVRLIDVAPGEIDVDTSDFFGLLPTDDDRASFGRAA